MKNRTDRALTRLSSTWIFVFIASIYACGGWAAGSDRLMFWSKTKGDSTSYISKDHVPFRVDLPGKWLLAGNPAYNHAAFRTEADPRKIVSIFDYREGFFSSR